MSGTPNQVQTLIPNTENGLFSRFCFYQLKYNNKWKDVFEKKNIDISEISNDLGATLLNFFKRINQSEKNEFQLTTEQERVFNETFEGWHTKSEYFLGENMIATIRRLGLVAFRIAMILSAIRYIEKDMPKTITCKDDDFNTSLKIVELLRSHASNIYLF